MNCKDLNIMCPACSYCIKNSDYNMKPYDPYTNEVNFPFRCWILRGEHMLEGKSNKEVKLEIYHTISDKHISKSFIQFIIQHRYPQYKEVLNKMMVLL
jgi:hypothetical protein